MSPSVRPWLPVTLPRLGINVKFAKDDEPESFEALIDSNTKVGVKGGG